MVKMEMDEAKMASSCQKQNEPINIHNAYERRFQPVVRLDVGEINNVLLYPRQRDPISIYNATKSEFQSVTKIEIVKTEVNLSEDPLWLGFAVTDDFSLPNCTEGIPELEEKVNAQSSLPSLDFTGFSEIDAQRACHASEKKRELLLESIPALQDVASGPVPPDRETSRRRRPPVNYREGEDLDDSSIFCDECCRMFEGDCPVHGPLNIIPDKKVSLGANVPGRDVKTLPDFLNVGLSKVSATNTGVWAAKDVQARQRFGHYEGNIERRETTNTGYSWKIKNGMRLQHCVNAENSSCSNWLRHVNYARSEEEQNLIAFQYRGEIYYRTYKPIPKGSELLVCHEDGHPRNPSINLETSSEVPTVPQQEARQTPTAPSKNTSRIAQNARQTDPSSSGREGTVHCSLCNRICLGQDRLHRDVKHRHGHIGRNGKYKCEWCQYSTNTSSNMTHHRRTHTGERPYRCDDCGKTFARRYYLAVHRRMHLGQRPCNCDVCGKAFCGSSELNRHRRIHTGEKVRQKVRQCEQCCATFSRTSDYTDHMNAHNGIRPYKCSVCSARFVKKATLTVHLRTHTGERPYSCSFCPARFARLGTVKRHLLIHTGERPHSCSFCPARFALLPDMKRHVANIHKHD